MAVGIMAHSLRALGSMMSQCVLSPLACIDALVVVDVQAVCWFDFIACNVHLVFIPKHQ